MLDLFALVVLFCRFSCPCCFVNAFFLSGLLLVTLNDCDCDCDWHCLSFCLTCEITIGVNTSSSTTTMANGNINMTMNNMMHVHVTHSGPAPSGVANVSAVSTVSAAPNHSMNGPPPMFNNSNTNVNMNTHNGNVGAHFGYNGNSQMANIGAQMMNQHPNLMAPHGTHGTHPSHGVHPSHGAPPPPPPPQIHYGHGQNVGHNQYGNVNNMNVNNGNNGNNNNNSNNNNNGSSDNKLNINLPKAIKKKLIFDWEQITKHNKLMSLPRGNGERVIDVLRDYEEYANQGDGQNGDNSNTNNNNNANNKQHQKDVIAEIVRGLRDYFDQALEVTLLYKFERPQLNDLIAHRKDLSMSQIYGVEHLCRLFGKFIFSCCFYAQGCCCCFCEVFSWFSFAFEQG